MRGLNTSFWYIDLVGFAHSALPISVLRMVLKVTSISITKDLSQIGNFPHLLASQNDPLTV